MIGRGGGCVCSFLDKDVVALMVGHDWNSVVDKTPVGFESMAKRTPEVLLGKPNSCMYVVSSQVYKKGHAIRGC